MYYNSRNSDRFWVETSGNVTSYELRRRDDDPHVRTDGQPGWGGTSRPYDRDSYIGNPMFVNEPRYNDFFTQPGSIARNRAAQTPEQATICGSGPDIGFLESCF